MNFQVAYNFPNPFKPSTKIKFSIPETGIVKLLGMTVAHDVGRAINPLAVEGQMDGQAFSDHGQILNLEREGLVHSVTGTFINRNYFAGYLLMVIPLSVGYLLSRRAGIRSPYWGWRHRHSSLDGKTLLIGFGVIVMMIALIFSASRMGISSLLLSFSLLIFLFRDPRGEKRFSKTSILIFTLAFLWAIWIGLDAVLSRFFTSTEDFKFSGQCG